MRIGVVCPYDIGRPGGVQQLSGELTARLRDMGEDVVFVGAGESWFEGGPGLDDVTIPVGRSTSIRANESLVPLRLNPIGWRRVRRALEGVDVIHVHEPLAPMVGWMALSIAKPTVATFHADPPAWVPYVYRYAPWVAGRLRDSTITAVSPTAATALPSGWGEPHIVPNAIDVASYQLTVDREDLRVAFLGRDEPRKGLSVLLDAWPTVHSRYPDSELVVMGADRGDDRPGVRFTGPVSGEEKRRLLASSRVFVAPNLGGESFGIVVIEAMAAGCAVVASDLPSFLDVTGGDSAVHVPKGDGSALAAAISDLLGDGPTAMALGEAGRERAQRYDWPVVVEEYRRLYAKAGS